MKRFIAFLFLVTLVVLAASGCSEKKPVRKITVNFTGPDGMSMSYRGRPLDGTVRKMLPGEYIFKFEAPGHDPLWQKITVTPQMQDCDCPIELEPVTSAVYLTSSAPGQKGDLNARISCNGKPLGQTPKLITALPLGRTVFTLSLPGYADQSVAVEIKNARPLPKIDTLLQPVSGLLIVSGKPKGATLWLDGKKIGPIPWQGRLNAGRVRVEVRAEGYQPYMQEIQLASGDEKRVQPNLLPSPSTLEVISDPPQAELFIHGKKAGTTPCKLENIQPGNCTIELRRSGCDPYKAVIDIKPGSAERHVAHLRSGVGSVRLHVRPAGVAVYIDGKSAGRSRKDPQHADETLPIEIGDLAPGSHVCTLVHPRGNPARRKIVFAIRGGETTECKPVEIWVADCRIEYNDGKKEFGRLISRNEQFLDFSPYPGISHRIELHTLKKITVIDSEK